MNKWIQKAYAILMTCLCLFQYMGSLTQVVSADAPADGNAGVTLRGAELSTDGNQLTLKYSTQTAKDSLHFCAAVTGGSLTDGQQGTLKDSQDQEIGDYYTNVDSKTGASKVNLNIEGGKKVDDATLTLPLSNAPDKVTVTDDSNASNTVTATKPQAAAAPVNLNDYMPDGQSVAKIVDFSFKDAQGNDIKPDKDGTYELPADAQVKYDYQFAIPTNLKNNYHVRAGDYFTFDLPATAKAEDSQGQLDGNPSLGSYAVKDNKVTITLNQNATGNVIVKGNFVHTESAATITKTGYGKIVTPITDSKNVIAVNREDKTQEDVNKSGTPVNSKTGSAENAKQISWDVVFNTARKLLTNASVTDPLADGLSLSADTPVAVQDVTTNKTLTEGSDFTFDRNDDNRVSLKGDYAKTGDAFKVTYLTDISEDKIPDEGGQANFTNTATLHEDDQDLPATGTVTVNYGKLLDKGGSTDGQGGQIFDWNLNYNYGEKTVKAGTQVTDKLLVTPQNYLQETLRVRYVDFDENGKAVLGDEVPADMYDLTYDTSSKLQKFTLTWKQNLKRAVNISYQTQATVPLTDETDPKLGDKAGDQTAGLNIRNEAGTGITTIPFTVVGSQQELQKTLVGTNYNKKTNDWTLTVNKGKQLFTSFQVTDKLPNGLKLAGQPEVRDDDTGKILTAGTDYELANTGDNTQGFHLVFIGAYQSTSDKFTINYQTDFNTEANATDTWNNEADSFWTDGNGHDHNNRQVVPFTPGDKFLHDASKGGEYNAATKHITWTVGVNYNQRQLKNAQVIDPIPEGQTYMPNTVHVYRAGVQGGNVNGNGDGTISGPGVEVPATDYTVNYDAKQDVLTINLPQDSGAYYVKFDTTLANQLIDTASYQNTAEFNNDHEHHVVTGTVTVNNAGDYIDKAGDQDGDVVNWSVDVNPSQSTLSNVKVVDNPTANQFVDANSIAVYQIVPGQPDQKAVAGKDYTVNVQTDYNTGKQTLTIAFTGTIMREYRVDYTAKINAAVDQSELRNDVTINADNISEHTSTKTVTVTLQHNEGTANCIAGPNLNFKLTKVDGDNPSTPLTGVHFMLFMAKKSTDDSGSDGYVKDGDMIREGSTSSDGTISWSNLKPGEYILQEDLSTTPKGYTAGAYAKGKHITIQKTDSETNAQGNSVDVDDQKVANNEYHGEVTLTKTSRDTGERLADATYELYRDDNDTGKSATTDQDGKLHFFNLVPGQYYLQETKAPATYRLNSKKYHFTISRDKTADLFQTVNATDAKWRGSVEVTKVDFNQPDKELAGAEFKLYNDAGKAQADVMTGGNGVARVHGLLPGKYYFKEVQAPAGYKLDADTKYFVQVDQQAQEQQQGTHLPASAQTSAYDEELTGGMKLLKLDGLTQTPLAGAEFTLYSALNPGVALRTGLTTNAQGELNVTKLIPGAYYLVETKAPAGYILPMLKQQYHFTVAFNQQQDQVPVVKAQNTSYLGRLQLTKESKQNGVALPNAVYGLFDAKGVQKRTLTTDDQGNALAEYLEPGAYTLRELKAPSGYKLDTTAYPVTIGKKTNGDTARLTVFDAIQCGRVKLHKTDAQTGKALQGAQFTLYRDTQSGADKTKFTPVKVTTNADGDAEVKNLQPGRYYFVETKAPTGYSFDGSRKYAVTVATDQDDAQVPVASVQDEPYRGNVQLTKRDAQSQQPVAGALYALYDGNGKLLKKQLTTAKDGSIKVTDLVPGDYYFKETKAPAGYDLNTAKVPVKVAFNQPDETAKVSTTDQETTGGVVLSKTDVQNGQILPGAHFDLYRANGTRVRSDLTTAADGQLRVSDLLPGSYYFLETQAPAGYALNANNRYDFKVDFNQQQRAQVNVTNKQITGGVRLVKSDAATGKLLAGAQFSLYQADGTQVRSNLTTDANGQLTVAGLLPGQYYFVETKAPTGYALNTQNRSSFTIGLQQQAQVQVNVTNTQKTGSVRLVKTDAATATRLAGAQFSLYKNDGTLVRSGLTTNQDGQLTVSGLAVGNYYFVETAAPSGYTRSQQHYDFAVAFDQQAPVTVNATNSKTPQPVIDRGSVKLIKRDYDSHKLLAGAQFDFYKADGTLMRTALTTDANGEITVSDLLPGDYYFVETKAPQGYAIWSGRHYNVTLRAGLSYVPSVTAWNKAVPTTTTNTPQPPLPDTLGPQPPVPGNNTHGNPPVPDTVGNNDRPPLPDTYGNNGQPPLANKHGKKTIATKHRQHKRTLQDAFPQTGDAVNTGLVVLGILLLAFSTTLVFLRRKRS